MDRMVSIPSSLVTRLVDFIGHRHGADHTLVADLQSLLDDRPAREPRECVGFELVSLERNQVWDRRLTPTYDRARDMRADLLKRGFEVLIYGLYRAPVGSFLDRPEGVKCRASNRG